MKLRSALGVGVVLGLLLLSGCRDRGHSTVNGHAPTPSLRAAGRPPARRTRGYHARRLCRVAWREGP